MTYRYPDACIVVFCKAPIVGEVKTRLMPALSASEAAQAHITLTERLLTWLSASTLCPVHLWCSPDTDHAFFQRCATQYGVSLYSQCEGDLGVKMDQAIQASLAEFEQVLLVGSDCPSLSKPDLIQALSDLDSEQDVVLAPAEDGGYVMIGSKASQPALFTDMVWGTNQVFQSTVDRLNRMGLHFSTTPMQWDVDRFEDWQRFCQMK
jgi:rSAM/selenodomain-associated transferase 1